MLKIIITILATIGGFVLLGILAIAVLYFVVARRVTLRLRQSLKEFESLTSGTIDADYFRDVDAEEESFYDVPPMRIHLVHAEFGDGADEQSVLRVTKWMEKHDFEHVGDFEIEEMKGAWLRVFLSRDRLLVAAVRCDEFSNSPYVEFCFDLGSGRRGGVSNPPLETIPLPEGAIGEHFPDDLADGLHVLPRMLKRAKALAMAHHARPVPRDQIMRFFEVAHAAEMDARILRGGLTTEEIRRALPQDSLLPADIQEIQNCWQDAIEEFLLEQSPKGMEVVDYDGEILVVHDGSYSSVLLQRVQEFYADAAVVDPKELKRYSMELEDLLKRFTPREAMARFRPLLPESLRYDLIDQLRKPVEADLYILPQFE